MRSLAAAEVNGLSKDMLVAQVAVFLDQPDMADFPIVEFRKLNRWEFTDHLVKMYDEKRFNAPIIKNAILRYALESPRPAAAELIKRVRKDDPERIQELEEELKSDNKWTIWELTSLAYVSY